MATLALKGHRVTFFICGYQELAEHGFQHPGLIVVQCGHGAWAEGGYQGLAKWSKYQRQGGHVPDVDASPDEKALAYASLTAQLRVILNMCLSLSTQVPCDCTLAFFDKAGRHHSYGLMIAFLMYATHVHYPEVWAELISPIRNCKMQDSGRPNLLCELGCLMEISPYQKDTGYVAYYDVLREYAGSLNVAFPLHAWGWS